MAVKETEDMVMARLQRPDERKVNAERNRLAGTRSFSRVNGKASDPTDADPKRQQKQGRQPRQVLDDKFRLVPRSMVEVMQARGQTVIIQEASPS